MGHAANLVLLPVFKSFTKLSFHLTTSKVNLYTYKYRRLLSLVNVASVILVIALFCRNLQARQTVFEDEKNNSITI